MKKLVILALFSLISLNASASDSGYGCEGSSTDQNDTSGNDTGGNETSGDGSAHPNESSWFN